MAHPDHHVSCFTGTMATLFTGEKRQLVLRTLAVLLVLGFICQIFALDRFVDPLDAAGSPTHAGTQYCHGSLSNCAGTVDIGSTLHATLTPPVAPEARPDTLALQTQTLAGRSPLLADPPPQLS